MKAIIEVSGIVQGVGFRPFVYRISSEIGIKGFVQNLGDSGVRINAWADKRRVDELVERIKKEHPVNCIIDHISVSWETSGKPPEEFRIIKSTDSGGEGFIPPDTAICGKCLAEVLSSKDRRKLYAFTSCTDCGPRFSILSKTPVDRENTSFQEFEPCNTCKGEYSDPKDRRFHAQTIACTTCGPDYFLLDKEGKNIKNPIDTTIEKLKNGAIIAIKGTGGVHLACDATAGEAVLQLREKLKRPTQPLAVMSPFEAIQDFAVIEPLEEKHIKSGARPVVLLKKAKDFPLAKEISPGLDTIGVMLPYAGIHHILFKHLDFPLVMTSANIPGDPMIVQNDRIIQWGLADYALLSDLDIKNRCDDSVIKSVNEKAIFIRRSRGFVPSRIRVANPEGKNILALGAERNAAFTILRGGDAIISQHIGNTSRLATLEFMENSIKRFLDMFPTSINQIACDLHPGFNTSALADEMGKTRGVPVARVQHHFAHCAGLALEHNLDSLITICCDGTGYGFDGSIWGGEVISFQDRAFKRIGHLKNQPMPGGDLCAYYPARMLLGMLYGQYPDDKIKKMLLPTDFRHGRKEIDSILIQLEKGLNTQQTTSAGRMLDAVSCALGVCSKRTYEGEPAIALEAFSAGGRDIGFDVKIDDNILDTTDILVQAIESKGKHNPRDIAYSTQTALGRGLADIATTYAIDHGIRSIGFCGGVAYNRIITRSIAEKARESSMNFMQNEKTPPGDGGISFGQTGYLLLSKK